MDNLVWFAHDRSRYIPGRVVRCTKCRCIYKIPHSPNVAQVYNDDYANEFLDEDKAAESEFTQILTFINETQHNGDSLLLDIGCGPGAFLEAAEGAGFVGHGIELTAKLAAIAKRRFGDRIICSD